MNNTENMGIFDEITSHLLMDDTPSEYFNRLSSQPEFYKYPFNLLLKLKETKQSEKNA